MTTDPMNQTQVFNATKVEAENLTDANRPIKVVAIVEGGVVQVARSSRPDVELEVLDRDNFAVAVEIDGETEEEADKRLTQECPHIIY